MSLRQRIRLELEEDGVVRFVEVAYDGRDLRAWEAKHRKSALNEPTSVGMLTWLGWAAGRRTGELNGAYTEYSAFDAVCTSVEGVHAPPAEEDEEDPTRPRRGSTPKRRGGGSSAP